MLFGHLLQELGAVKKFRTEPKDSAVAEFKARGGQVTGGAFATVWMHPRWNYVWKTFPHNQAYIQYLEYAASHKNNPHFPRIYKIKKIVPPFARPSNAPFLWAVKMEKLSPLSKENWEMVDAARGILLGYDFRGVEAFKKQYPNGMSLMRTIQLLEDARGRQKPQVFDDLHKQENFMQRDDGTVVITDPWWTQQKLPKATHNLTGGSLDKLKESVDTLDGFEQSGGSVQSGAFAVVLSHPAWDYVWKVSRNDTGYQDFLKLTEDYPSPNFPRVMDVRIEGDLLLTKLEALQPIDNENWKVARAALRVMNHWSTRESFEAKYPTQVGLLDAISVIMSNRRGAFLDFERENFMQRPNGTVVITDPMWKAKPNGEPIEFDTGLIQNLT